MQYAGTEMLTKFIPRFIHQQIANHLLARRISPLAHSEYQKEIHSEQESGTVQNIALSEDHTPCLNHTDYNIVSCVASYT